MVNNFIRNTETPEQIMLRVKNASKEIEEVKKLDYF